jgi:hypothetical protein
MKLSCMCLLFAVFFSEGAIAQVTTGKTYRNFPVVLSVQFHSLSSPFKDLKTNFKNIGFGVGTEIALGSTHNWAQQFQLSWYRNQRAGNGILLYTQSAWRPTIVSNMYAGIKLGFGLTYTFRPVESYKQNYGEWTAAGHKGKWLFTVPLGLTIGYHKFSEQTYFAPFISYQLLLNSNYARGVPVMTNSIIEAGSSIHLSAKN